MSAFGVLLLSCGAWVVFCGVESLDPVKTAARVLQDPGHATDTIAGAVAAVITSPAPRESTGGSFGPNPVQSMSGSGKTAYLSYAESLFPTYLWSIDQATYLDQLWTRESSWNPNAKNPSSGAYGIPQALPASKMAAAGTDYLTNAQTQIKWGLGYIHSRYGTPKAAWAHEISQGWY